MRAVHAPIGLQASRQVGSLGKVEVRQYCGQSHLFELSDKISHVITRIQTAVPLATEMRSRHDKFLCASINNHTCE